MHVLCMHARARAVKRGFFGCGRNIVATGVLVENRSWHPPVQIRSMWHDPRITRQKDGLPLFTASSHLLVSKNVPIVLKEDVNGVGVKGEIVHVKRGFARHVLVPNNLAAFATTWENIDRYADPKLVTDLEAKAQVAEKIKAHAFDWVNDIRLNFVRDTSGEEKTLGDPVTIWCILEQLSQDHELDLLPGNVTFKEPLDKVGEYKIPIEIMFKGSVLKQYTVPVCIKSKMEEQRHKKMQAASSKRPSFLLGQRSIVNEDDEDEDENHYQ